MKHIWVLVACVAAAISLPVLAQQGSEKMTVNPALEKELYALELKWMKAEHDKKTTGPESMGEMWTDDFFDVLPHGRRCPVL